MLGGIHLRPRRSQGGDGGFEREALKSQRSSLTTGPHSQVLELEARCYEKSMDKTIIATQGSKDHEVDFTGLAFKMPWNET